MKLIVMTNPKLFIEEDKIISALFDEGMETLHVWKPDALPIYLERLLTLISDDYRKRIVVHEHFYLRDEFNLGGICLADETDDEPRNCKGKVCCVCNDINNLKMAQKKFQYVLLKGCFTDGGYSEDVLKKAAKECLITKKIYALGGNGLDDFKMAKDLGFGGVVMQADLWNKFEIHQQDSYNELITYFKKINNILS